MCMNSWFKNYSPYPSFLPSILVYVHLLLCGSAIALRFRSYHSKNLSDFLLPIFFLKNSSCSTFSLFANANNNKHA